MPEQPASPAEADSLLDRILDAPETEWRAALEDTCARHPAIAARLVHRDVKADNIVVDSGGRPVLIDFEPAHVEDALGDQLTRPGEPLGTPGYMAPEQVLGNAVAWIVNMTCNP